MIKTIQHIFTQLCMFTIHSNKIMKTFYFLFVHFVYFKNLFVEIFHTFVNNKVLNNFKNYSKIILTTSSAGSVDTSSEEVTPSLTTSTSTAGASTVLAEDIALLNSFMAALYPSILSFLVDASQKGE